MTNQSYTSYMLDVANKGGPLEILMAVLACAWSYQVIGEHHVKVPGAVEHPLYGEWVQGYSSKEYADSTKEIIDCVDALGENITPEQEAYLTDIFVNAAAMKNCSGIWLMPWRCKEGERKKLCCNLKMYPSVMPKTTST